MLLTHQLLQKTFFFCKANLKLIRHTLKSSRWEVLWITARRFKLHFGNNFSFNQQTSREENGGEKLPVKASDGGASKKSAACTEGRTLSSLPLTLSKWLILIFVLVHFSFACSARGFPSRHSFSPREPDIAFGADKFSASLLYNFLKLLVSGIIISHFHKISLNGWWQATETAVASLKLPFLNYIWLVFAEI